MVAARHGARPGLDDGGRVLLLNIGFERGDAHQRSKTEVVLGAATITHGDGLRREGREVRRRRRRHPRGRRRERRRRGGHLYSFVERDALALRRLCVNRGRGRGGASRVERGSFISSRRPVGNFASVVADGARAVRGPCLKWRAAVARGSLGVKTAPSKRALGPAAAARAAICRLRKIVEFSAPASRRASRRGSRSSPLLSDC
jgi:hypothetical protein